jgi:hypothetical protein
MRPTLSAALSLALLASPAFADGPCDTLAAAINVRYAAGVSARDIGADLAFREIPGARMPTSTAANVRVGRVAFGPDTGARQSAVPHAPGVRFVEFRDGTASCQVFALYRLIEGRVRALSASGVGGDGDFCGDSAVRPLAVGDRAFVAQVEGYGPGMALHPVGRDGMGRALCAVAFETRFEGRIEALEPNDAASVQARRPAMAAIEAALPALANSFRRATREFPLPEARIRADGNGDLTVEFASGEARYVARIVDEGGREPRLGVRLARVYPELGNRERPLGSFVYGGERRFVRALSRPAEFR